MKINLIIIFCLVHSISYAQMDVPPVGGNPRATITETIGITAISLDYSRPDVGGRAGKIWGTVVSYGFTTNSFITNRPTAPWRAGANENTTIRLEHDVKVEGKPLAAGTYGLHMAVWPDSVWIIFSKSHDAWGSFYYEEKDDALRVMVKPLVTDKTVEWLKYEFIDHKANQATIALVWEKWMIPFTIEVDVDAIVVNRLREQVTSIKGFNSTNMLQASQYCLNKGINLDEALSWAQRAVSGFQGQRSYVSLRNLATAYEKLHRLSAADSVMVEALSMANAAQYTAYARSLISQKRLDKAQETIQAGKTKYGDVAAIHSGWAYLYSAQANYTKAIEAATRWMQTAPTDAVKKQVEGLILRLKENKDINQN
jgi:tetratricopeptide (TPR) repeat protein